MGEWNHSPSPIAHPESKTSFVHPSIHTSIQISTKQSKAKQSKTKARQRQRTRPDDPIIQLSATQYFPRLYLLFQPVSATPTNNITVCLYYLHTCLTHSPSAHSLGFHTFGSINPNHSNPIQIQIQIRLRLRVSFDLPASSSSSSSSS